MHYINDKGKRQWQARRGLQAGVDRARLDALVRRGLASHWRPLRSVADAIAKAGI